MKSKQISSIILLIAFVVSISSCRRCMCCGPLLGNIKCINGSDTVLRHTDPGTRGNIVDSLNVYQAHGYTCTSQIYPFIEQGGRGAYCNVKDISNAEAMGYGCVFPDGYGNCGY